MPAVGQYHNAQAYCTDFQTEMLCLPPKRRLSAVIWSVDYHRQVNQDTGLKLHVRAWFNLQTETLNVKLKFN